MLNQKPDLHAIGMTSDDIKISEDGKFFIVDMKRFDEDDDYAWRVVEEINRSPRKRISDLPNLEYILKGLKLMDPYLADIHQILSTKTAPGLLSKSGKDLNGCSCTHRFSLAVGLASSHWLHKNRKFFDEYPPQWIEQIHPYHALKLCKLAIARKTPLPQNLD